MALSELISPLTLVAALGAGLNAGLFFAFSVSVMPALARLPAAQGIAAMQSINAAILNPVFFVAFFGAAAVSVVLGVLSVLSWSEGGSLLAIAGSLLFVIGALVVTIACNVPRNNALDAVASGDPQSAALWSRYLTEWTVWNHVRALACLAALGLLVASL